MASGSIEQIKEKLDIVNEIGTVVALKRAGKAYKGLCPFHNERTPSFYVFPDSKTWRCFGCNEGGDVFSFVAKQQNLDFGETLRLLAEKAGVDLHGDDGFAQESSAQSQARTRLRALNDAAAVWFHHQLLTASGATYARSYLQTRGISNESIERFRLGYAPEGDALTRYLLEQGYAEEELIEAGLARRREAERGQGLYDYFRNRLVFTIRDARGQTIGFGARELGGGTPKYLNTPQTLLFDKSSTLYGMDLAREAIRKQDGVVIVEGYVDALMAHQYGYANTVACIGSAITVKHVQQIKRMTRRLILALDPDAAGEAATLRAIQVAQEGFDRELVPVAMPADGVRQKERPQGKSRRKPEAPQGMVRFEEQVNADIRVLQLPDGIDPDEFIRADPPAWEAAVQNALPLIDFYFTQLVADLDLHAPAGQAEAGRRLFPVLAPIADRVKQDAYVRRLANLLRIPERDAQMELQRYRRQHIAQQGANARNATDGDIAEKYPPQDGLTGPKTTTKSMLADRASAGHALESLCIGLLLSNPQCDDEVYVILLPSDFWGTETRTIFALLASLTGSRTHLAVETLLATQPEILRQEAQRLQAAFEAQPQLDRVQLAKTLKQIAYRLKHLRLSEAITNISYLQRDAEEQGDLDAVRLFAEQGLQLHRELHKFNPIKAVQT
jgi:DNA primase